MDRTVLTAKHKNVRFWLEKIFADEEIPKCEINTETVNALYSLYEHNKEMDRLTRLTIDDINEKTAEYKAEAADLNGIMEGVGLPVYTLSNAGKSSLKMLTDLATILNIKDVNKSSYCLAMADLSEELSRCMELVARKQQEIKELKSQTESVIKHLDKISQYYNQLEEHSAIDIPVAEREKNDTILLRNKCEKYTMQIAAFEEDGANEINKDLQHETLLSLAKELENLKAELKPLQVQHKSYRSLPPDSNLTRVKIAEAKRELVKLESELQSDVDLLTNLEF